MKIQFSSRVTCRGFSLVEAVIAIAIVGTLMVGAMNMVGASVVARQQLVHKSMGLMLAEDLMSEILGPHTMTRRTALAISA